MFISYTVTEKNVGHFIVGLKSWNVTTAEISNDEWLVSFATSGITETSL